MSHLRHLLIACIVLATFDANAEVRIRFALPYPLDATIEKAARTLQASLAGRSDPASPTHVDLVHLTNENDTRHIIAGLNSGLYDLAMIPSSILTQQESTGLQVFELPFLFSSLEEVQDVQASDVGGALLSLLEERDLVGLAYWNIGLNQFVSNKPISKFSDLEGLKIRFSSPIQNKVLEALGANSTAIEWSEVYTALSTGTVDAAEGTTNLAADIFASASLEGGNYYSELNLRPSFGIIAVRTGFWRQLSYRVQYNLANLVRTIGVAITSDILSREEESRDALREGGLSFAYLSEGDYREMRRKMRPLWEEMGGRIVEVGLLDRMFEILQHSSDARSLTGSEDPSSFDEVTIRFVTDRADEGGSSARFRFGSKRGSLIYGEVGLHTPPGQVIGSMTSDGVVFNSIRLYTWKEFVATKDEDQPVLVFVHGYNTSFEEATVAAASLADALQFKGMVIVYSWPSDGVVAQYIHDMTAADYTKRHFVEFITAFSRRGAIPDVIAHSMGARVVVRAMEVLSENLDEVEGFNFVGNLVFAAPDEDAEIFRDLAAIMNDLSGRITLYASSKDRLLQAARLLHGAPRAGESGDDLLDIDGIDSIDATAADTGVFGHSYVTRSRVIADLHQILTFKADPDRRALLERIDPVPEGTRQYPYWRFRAVD